jgi:hypothetical protein
VYGVESQTVGLGGVAAQAPPDIYFPQAIAISSGYSGIVGTPGPSGSSLPQGVYPGAGLSEGMATSEVAQTPLGQNQTSWTSIFDFHNSVAPWILLAVLILYGWLHISVRASGRAGPMRTGADAVL